MSAAATIRHVQILTALGQRARRKRIPKQIYPKGIEREYASTMVGHLASARDALTPLLHALPRLLDSARAERKVDANETAELRRLMEEARRQIAQSVSPTAVETLAKKFGTRTMQFNRVQLGRQVRAAFGVDVVSDNPKLGALLEHFVSENVALIKSVPSQVVDQVEGIVNRAFGNASSVKVIADEINERFSVGESRARVIARDQVGKLYGQTNAYRQKDLGVTQFIWRTSGDERVRPEHEDLDGETFDYSDPPDEGLPGEPIQCRCTAEPVFGTLRDGVDSEE
jgi:SPP1 gp7 family putative phage head morphogenesis protein